jgi:hypothetical protein
MIKLRYRLLCLAGLVATASLHLAWAATDAQPEKPKVHAMVAAVGEQFTIMTALRNTGSHLSPYRGDSFKVKANFLNYSVLRTLDKAMAAIDPDSTRIYMTLPSVKMDAAEKWEREDVALHEVEASLQAAPERAQWDRIIVVTPAYRPYEANGLGGRLIGIGIFYQPICRSRSCSSNTLRDTDSPAAVTPDDKPIRAYTYVAPYSFLDIWVLDAKTFAVIDRIRTYDSTKVFDPRAASFGLFGDLDIHHNVSAEDQAKYVFRTLETSVEKAVARSEVLNQGGIVNVGDTKEVKSGKQND